MAVSLAQKLLRWYDDHQRSLPWRATTTPPDPYAVWLSEIMLQQTTVVTVISYFGKFIRLWPTIHDLAGAPLDDVLHAWQGLGYYARARNMHKCAQKIVADYDGHFPDDEKELLTLPGIGAYTAAAIAAIAFDRPATIVDGNVERVISRMYEIQTPLPQAKKEIYAMAQKITPQKRAGDYAQAIMDLGATICTPKNPGCEKCPWEKNCGARAHGSWQKFPVKGAKKKKPTRFGIIFWVENNRGEILLEQRPPSGLLGGMMGFPGTVWREKKWALPEAMDFAPAHTAWNLLPGVARHSFTHFDLEMTIAVGRVENPSTGFWCAPGAFHTQALPTVMKKVIRHQQHAASL